MYEIIVVLAMFGLIFYFGLPVIFSLLIFTENKEPFVDKSINKRKILIGLLAVIVTLIAISSIIVSFEHGMNVFQRIFLILSSITYICLSFKFMKSLFKIKKVQSLN